MIKYDSFLKYNYPFILKNKDIKEKAPAKKPGHFK